MNKENRTTGNGWRKLAAFSICGCGQDQHVDFVRAMKIVVLSVTALCAFAALAVSDHSIAEFPRLAGETDDAPRFQRAVDACYGGGVLTVPSGDYVLAQTVFVTNLCSIEMSAGAYVKAVAEIDWMFKINQMWQYNPKTAPKDVAVIRQDGGVLASQR